MDVLEIDGASNRGIDEIRQLREEVGFAASAGKRKVYIIDEVHMLTPQAFNALLKTLEEPPPHVVFVFATTEPQKVPETILSRCQRYNFRRIPTVEIAGRLRMMVDEEGIQVEDEALDLIARRADGALRDAQSLLDQIHSFSEDRVISGDAVRDLLGIIPLDLFFEITGAVESGDGKSALALIDRVLTEGGDIAEFTEGLMEHFRHLLVARAGDGQGIPENDRERYLEAADRFQESDLIRMLQLISELELTLRRVAEPRFWLELTVMRIVQMSGTVEIKDVMNRLEGVLESGAVPAQVTLPATDSRRRPAILEPPSAPVSSKPEGGVHQKEAPPSPGPQAAPSNPKPKVELPPSGPAEEGVPQPGLPSMAPPPQEGPPEEGEETEGLTADADVTLEAVEAHWEDIVEEVKALRISVGTFLGEGKPAELSGRRLTILFAKRRELHALQVNRSAEVVQEAVAKVLGGTVRVTARVDYDTDDQPPKPEVPPEDDALIQTALRLFDGEILNRNE